MFDSGALLFPFQNYFSDPWNVFDFIIVLGSFIDISLDKLSTGVSDAADSTQTVSNSVNPTETG